MASIFFMVPHPVYLGLADSGPDFVAHYSSACGRRVVSGDAGPLISGNLAQATHDDKQRAATFWHRMTNLPYLHKI
jgi:hypothetical protein